MPDPAGMSRPDAATALGLTPKSVSNMLGTGRLRRVGRGLVDRVQVEELAASRAERRRQHAARVTARERPPRHVSGGELIDASEAAHVLGVTPQQVRRLAAADRLPWIAAGRSGLGRRRLYRRGQIQVIAAARDARQPGSPSTAARRSLSSTSV